MAIRGWVVCFGASLAGALTACGDGAAPMTERANALPSPSVGDSSDSTTSQTAEAEDGAESTESPASSSESDESSGGDRASTDETAAAQPSEFVSFRDPVSGFATTEVHDVDREVFRFDAMSIIRVDTGAAESGWITDGNDLGRAGRFGTFMVRFGMEGGEQRAYFTEVERPTICDLRLTGPDELQIFATNAGVPSE